MLDNGFHTGLTRAKFEIPTRHEDAETVILERSGSTVLMLQYKGMRGLLQRLHHHRSLPYAAAGVPHNLSCGAGGALLLEFCVGDAAVGVDAEQHLYQDVVAAEQHLYQGAVDAELHHRCVAVGQGSLSRAVDDLASAWGREIMKQPWLK